MKYEWTATLNPIMHKYKNYEQYDRTVSIVEEVCRGWKCFIKAELTQIYNIHYHCIIEMEDKHEERNKFWDRLRNFPKQLGKKQEFKPVQYEHSFKAYLTTEKIEEDKVFKNIVKRPVIIRDELNVIREMFFKEEDVVAEPCVPHKEDTSSLDAIEEALKYINSMNLGYRINLKK